MVLCGEYVAPLEVHSNTAMKDQGLSGVGVVVNFIRRWVQPLQERIHYGFEYTVLEDPTRVTTDELTEGEVLERI